MPDEKKAKSLSLEEIAAIAKTKQKETNYKSLEGYNSNIAGDTSRVYSKEEVKQYDDYYALKDTINKQIKQQAEVKADKKLEDPTTMGDIARTLMLDTVSWIGKDISVWLDIPEWRPSAFVPTGEGWEATGRDIFAYTKNRLEDLGAEFDNWTEEDKIAYDEKTDKIRAGRKNNPLVKAVEWALDDGFKYIDSKIDPHSTSNVVYDVLEEGIRERNLQHVLKSDFTLNNEMPFFQEREDGTGYEGVNWLIAGIQQGLPTLASSIIESSTLAGAAGNLTKGAQLNKVTQEANKALRVKKSMVTADQLTAVGISLAQTHGEASAIQNDVFDQSLLIVANELGGEQWKKNVEQVSIEAERESRAAGRNDAQVQHDVEEAIKESIHTYFKDGDPETYKQIIGRAESAGRLAYGINTNMMITNMVDGIAFTDLMRFRRKTNAALKGLGETKFSRAKIKKPAKYGRLKAIGTAAFSEGVIEEGGINKYGEWAGLALAEDKSFHFDEFMNRTLSGESADEIFFGALMGAGMVAFANRKDYAKKRRAFEKYEEASKKFLKQSPEALKEQLKNLVTMNSTASSNAALQRKIANAEKKGEDSTPLINKYLHEQALTAFKVGAGEELLNSYQSIANTAKDAETREIAQKAIEEILVLEQDYNYAKQFSNHEGVFENLSNQRIVNEQINELQTLSIGLKTTVSEKLEGMKARFDGDYKITDKGIVFTGKDREIFREAALKTKEVSEYNQRLNDKTQLESINDHLVKKLDKLTSMDAQMQVESMRAVGKEVNKNLADIFGSETKQEFHSKISNIIDEFDLNKSSRKAIHDAYAKQFDAISIAGQKQTNKKGTPAPVKPDIKGAKINGIAEKFRGTKTQEETDESPADISDLSESDKRDVKNYVGEFASEGMTFDKLIEEVLGINDNTLSDKDKQERKSIIEEQFNMFVAGWEMNGFDKADFGAVYQKYFGKEETKTASIINKFANILSKKTGKKVETPFGTPQEVTQEEVEKAAQESKTEEVAEKKSEKQSRLYKLQAEVKLRFKVFTTTLSKATNLLESKFITDSNVKGELLMNPNKFNHGDALLLKPDTESNYKVPIVVNGETIATVKFDMYLAQKYSHGKSGKVAGRTQVTEKNGVFTFMEKMKNGDVNNSKSYDQRPPKTKVDKQHFITDDFLVVNDADYSALNDEYVETVRLKKVTNGKKSTIEVDIITKSGETTSRTVEIENEIEQNTPILVSDNEGNGVAWLETPAVITINEDRTPETTREAQKKLAEYRKRVINGDVKQSAIRQKVGDAFDRMVTPTPINEQDPNAQLGTIIANVLTLNGQPFENKKRVISDSTPLSHTSDGIVYELRKIGTNEQGQEVYFAFQNVSMTNKLDSVSASNIIWVMKAYLSQGDSSGYLKDIISENTRNDIRNTIEGYQGGQNIFNFKGVTSYLANFMITSIPNSVMKNTFKNGVKYKNVDPAEFLKYVNSPAIKEGEPVLMVAGKKVFFAIKGQQLDIMTENGPIKRDMLDFFISTEGLSKNNALMLESLFNYLENNADKFKRNHMDKPYGENHDVAQFDDTGNITTVSYKDHEHSTLKTDVKAYKPDGEDFHITATNTKVTLDTDVEGTLAVTQQKPNKKEETVGTIIEPLSTQLPESKTTEEALEDNPTPEELALLREAKHTLELLGSKNLNTLFDEELIDESIGDEELKAIMELMQKIPGVNPIQQHTLVMAVVNDIFTKNPKLSKQLISEGLEGSFDRIVLPNKQGFIDLLDKLRALKESNNKFENLGDVISELESRISVFDTIQEHWKEITDKATATLLKYSGLSDAQIETALEEANEAQDRIYNRESIEFNSKQSLPTELKKFMAGILEKNEKGEAIRGFAGVNTYVPFDVAVNVVTSIIGSTPRANMTFQEMMTILGENTDSFPFLSDLIKRLENAEPDMINKFMTHMVKHNMSMKYMMYSFNPKTKKYDLRIYDTNSSEIEAVLTNEWRSGLKISELIYPNSDGDFIINKTKAKELYDDFVKFKKSPDKVTTNELIDWLSEFGIVISENTMKEIMNDKLVTKKGKRIRFKDMFFAKKDTDGLFGGLAYMLEEYISTDDNVNITQFPSEHPFEKARSSISNVARIEAKYTNRAVTIAFRDGDKNIAGFVPTKFATDRVEDLKYNSYIRRYLKQDVYSTNSMLLNLLTGDNKEIEELLYVDHIGITAMRKAGTPVIGDNNSITKLAEGDQEMTKIGFFQDTRQGAVTSRYNGLKLRMARMFFPTMSDKKQMLAMYMPVLNLTGKEMSYQDGNLILDEKVGDVLFEQLVIPELKRILTRGKKKMNIEGYDLASQLFLMIPQLNNLKYEGVKVIKLMAQRPDIYNETWFENNFKVEAIETIKEVIAKEVAAKLKVWKTDGIITKAGVPEKLNSEYMASRDFKKDEAKLAATDFIINNLISLSNAHQLIAGDIAYYSSDKLFKNFGVNRDLIAHIPELNDVFSYKDVINELENLRLNDNITEDEYRTLLDNLEPLPYEGEEDYVKLTRKIGDNLGKRLALLLAPGNKIPGLKDHSYRQIFLKDSYEVASNIRFLVKLHYGEKGLEKLDSLKGDYIEGIAEEFPIVSDFFAVNSTDAQEFTTINEHLDILFGQGKLKKEDYDRFKDAVTKGEVIGDDADLKLIFQPIKPVYSGSTMDNGRMRMVYVKSSSYPLLPQVTQGLEIDALRIAMENLEKKGKNVRAAYKTASKVGATKTELDPFGDLSEEALLESSVELDRRNFRIQQDVPVHALLDTKDEVHMGTQLMKLLFGDGVTEMNEFQLDGETISGRDLLNEYNDTYGELINLLKADLYNELGLDKYGQLIDIHDFMHKLGTMLKAEAKARNYPQQDIDGLDIIVTKVEDGVPIELAFRNSIWLSSNSIRYEALLNSLVTKKLIKLKLPGYSYIAGSQKGYEVTDDTKSVDKSRMIYTSAWNGKELVAAEDKSKAQIFIPSRFRDIEGNLIDLFEGTGNDRKYIKRDENGNWKLKEDMVSSELLNITSFRIPTSAHVSASQVDIAGFLPPESGDLMIVPKEFAVQKGLDYDVDKEFSYHLWHVQNAEGKIVSIDEILKGKNINAELEAAVSELNELKKLYRDDQKFADIINEINEDVAFMADLMDSKVLKEVVNNTVEVTSDVEDEIRLQFARVKFLKNAQKRLLQNKIVKINGSVLGSTNPEIQSRINKVLSMEFAGTQAELLQDDDAEFNTLLSDEYQTMKMNLGAAGQMGIGVYSNYVVLNSLTQQLENSIYLLKKGSRVNITIGNFTSSGMLGRYTSILSNSDRKIIVSRINALSDAKLKEELTNKLDNGKLTFNEISQLVSDTKHKDMLDRIRPISEIFAERQNTATDNEKEQIMGRTGVTSATINIDSILALLGFDKGDTIKDIKGNEKQTSIGYLLISQPIVKEFVRRKGQRNSNVSDEFVSDKQIAEDLIALYGTKGTARKNLKSQVLYDNIKKAASNEIQVTALKLFLELESYATNISEIQQLMGITKNGLDKSLVNTIYLHEQLRALPNNDTFTNVLDLIGDFKDGNSLTERERVEALDDGYIVIGDQLIKPTTMMGHLLVNGVSTGYDLWTPFFPYTNGSLERIMDNIMNATKKETYSKNQEVEIKQLIIKEVKKYLNSTSGIGTIQGSPEAERQRLFMNEQGKPSLAAYLLKSQKNPTIASNALLASFKFDMGDEGQISKIMFDNTSTQRFDEEYLYYSFLDLMLNPQPLPDFGSVPDNMSYLLRPFQFGQREAAAILNFSKTVSVSQSDKGMTKGETKLTLIDGQRFEVTYHGNITKDEYDGDFTLENGLPRRQWGTNSQAFDNGENRNVFTFKPIYNTRKLAQDLVAYSFLSGGEHGTIGFVKYIPLRYLELVGFTGYMNNLNINDYGAFNEILGSEVMNSFSIQFFQHNPKLLPQLSRKKLGLQTKPVGKIDRIDLDRVEPDENGNVPDMFTIKNSVDNNFNIYVLSGNEYIRIPQVGVHGMSEYDVNKSNVNSLLNNYTQTPLREKRAVKSELSDDYDIISGDSTTILENITTRDDELGSLADDLLRLDNGGVKIVVEDIGSSKGKYNATSHTITINKALVVGGHADNQAQTFLHEYLHAVTSRELNQYFDHNGKPLMDIDKMPQHIQDLYSLFELSKKELNITDELMNEVDEIRKSKGILTTDEQKIAYSFTNVKEFVSMSMTNELMQQKLQDIKVKDTTLFGKFTEFLNKMLKHLNPDVDSNLLDVINNVVLDVIKTEQNISKVPQEKILAEAKQMLDEKTKAPETPLTIINHNLIGDTKFIEFSYSQSPDLIFRIQNDDGKYTLWSKYIGDETFTKYTQNQIDKFLIKHRNMKNFILGKFGNRVYEAFIAKTEPKVEEKVTEDPINIYAGTNENAELSNFAKRPIKFLQFGKFANDERFHDIIFDTVEGYFQAAKLEYTDAYTDEEILELTKDFAKMTGSQAKKAGRKIKGLDIKAWNDDSSDNMEGILKASFEQNPDALKKLLATGDAQLTHTQDKGKWGKEFPRILMKVRDELKQKPKTTPFGTPLEVTSEDIRGVKPDKDEIGDIEGEIGFIYDALISDINDTFANTNTDNLKCNK